MIATRLPHQVASLSNGCQGKHTPPHFVYSEVRKGGTEVRCDCPVFKSTPNVCQHALAAAEDICVLPDYLDWVSKTKTSLVIYLNLYLVLYQRMEGKRVHQDVKEDVIKRTFHLYL